MKWKISVRVTDVRVRVYHKDGVAFCAHLCTFTYLYVSVVSLHTESIQDEEEYLPENQVVAHSKSFHSIGITSGFRLMNLKQRGNKVDSMTR